MKVRNVMKSLIERGLVISVCVLMVGCTTSQMDSGKPALSLVEPGTQEVCLDDIPMAHYQVKVKNDQGEEDVMQFEWPWYAAIGGKILNESGVFERAAAGQIDQSTVVGMATRKYFLWSAHRAKAIRVALRDSFDWNEIRKVLLEVGGEGTLLTKLTPLPQEVIEKQVFRQNIPPEFFITGSLTEVTVAEESAAGGFHFAGGGISGKAVQTSVAGSLEITDPYTGELLISVMGQNRITAEQIGIEAFRIIAFNGTEEYLNAEYMTAKEMIKQQVQVELVDFLFYKAFKSLYETRPEYLTNRLHYRVGRIQGYAQELAAQNGFTVIDGAVPIPAEPRPSETGAGESLQPETSGSADTPSEAEEVKVAEQLADQANEELSEEEVTQEGQEELEQESQEYEESYGGVDELSEEAPEEVAATQEE